VSGSGFQVSECSGFGIRTWIVGRTARRTDLILVLRVEEFPVSGSGFGMFRFRDPDLDSRADRRWGFGFLVSVFVFRVSGSGHG